MRSPDWGGASECGRRLLRYQIPLFQKTTGGTRSTASQTSSNHTAKPELNLPSQKTKNARKPNQKSEPKNQKSKKQPWPKSLPDRAKSIESLLRSAPTPVTATQLANHFRKPRYDHLPEIQEILETLCTFGRARPGKEKGTYTT